MTRVPATAIEDVIVKSVNEHLRSERGDDRLLLSIVVASTGGVSRAALIMSSVYIIGVIVPFVPETVGKPFACARNGSIAA